MFEEMKIRHLLGISILFSIIAGIILVIFSANEEFTNITMNLILYVFIPIVFFGYYFRKQRRSVRQVMYTKGVQRWIPSLFGIVFVSIAFSLGAFWFTLFMLNSLFPPLVNFLMTEVPMSDNIWFMVFEILMITLFAPIVEEFIFRGVILHRLIRKTSVWGGILISSILFGFLHADVIGAFLFGVIASLLFVKTGNLLIPILLHMINNTIAVVFMFMEPILPKWMIIVEQADITINALPNAILLVISSTLIGFIVFKLSKGLALANDSKY